MFFRILQAYHRTDFVTLNGDFYDRIRKRQRANQCW
jgi:hypothetical protein